LFFTAALKRLKDDDESEEEETIIVDAGGCGVWSSAATKVVCERAPDVFYLQEKEIRIVGQFLRPLSVLRKIKKILVLGFEARGQRAR
jgi:hypothetical protein